MKEFILANSKEHFNIIAKLASIVWYEHYIPIIGKAQVEYMVSKFQTSNVMQEQAKEGYQYFIIKYNSDHVGYLSIKKNGTDLFLSKIYILKEYRGLKIGKASMAFIESIAIDFKCKTISLTVNKNNTNSIKAYEKTGFKNTEPIVMDIGNGFIMDDYKMIKTL